MSAIIDPSTNPHSKIQRRQSPVSDELAASNLHPLLQQLYANRGVKQLQQVSYSIKNLLDYTTLKGIDDAADIIAAHVRQDKKIIVVGDFDADGATSSALMVRALSLFGAMQVDFLVPNRFEYGYGLSPEIVALAAEQSPDLIITVDNGISSIEGVAEANRRNIQVVVTDHHLPADTVPAAAAIVNPNQQGCDFPSKAMAGVGVAFYVMLAVRASLRRQQWFESDTFQGRVKGNNAEPNMATLLDLVALGTVADVVPLDENNRLLVELGLQRIRQHRGCAGINALLTIAGKNIAACHSQDFGFAVGPRLNAAGRLEDMSLGIECLLSDDSEKAMALARQLDEINHQRKQIEGDMLSQALQVLESDELVNDIVGGDAGDGACDGNSDDGANIAAGLALFHTDWHQGVVGLLASRVKEKYHRPVFAFARAEEPGLLKGSGRSIAGLHLRDALDIMAKASPGLILKFGGHAMAAGLSIEEKNFALFKKMFDAIAGELLDANALTMVKETDGELSGDD
ncbi:MAG TPA: single-stranded-DNA-specific exonuclease RecJ, partial [Thiotrichales bacterium]|nr:single-stranded-DNA-specific exonuclease RecJ [Thiotrichales bacterium]